MQHFLVVILHILLILLVHAGLAVEVGLALAARLEGALVLGVADLALLILAVDLGEADAVHVDLACDSVLGPLSLIYLMYLWDLPLGMHDYSSVVVSRVLQGLGCRHLVLRILVRTVYLIYAGAVRL